MTPTSPRFSPNSEMRLPWARRVTEPRISQSGFRFVYGETEPGHDLPRPRQSLFRVSATEDEKVVGIIHDMRSVCFTAPLVSPVPEKAVHVAVGEQRADHPALRRSTGTLLAAAHAP